MKIHTVAVSPAVGEPSPRFLEYQEHILTQLAPDGTHAATGNAGDIFWDPYCTDGIFPQSLPPLSSGRPVVVTVHGAGHWGLPARDYFATAEDAAAITTTGLGQLQAWIASSWRIHRLIVPTEAVAETVTRVLGFPAARIVVVPPGIDHGCFSPKGATGEPVDGFLCIMERMPGSNVPRLLEAWSRLPEEDRPPLTLVAPGYRGSPLPPGVRLVTDQLSAEERAAYYRSALALVQPQFETAGGEVIAEAMACGCPVLASGSASLRELYDHAYCAFDARDPDEIHAALERISGSSNLRSELALAGLARVRDRTWAVSAAGHHEVFEQALLESGRSSPRGHAVLVLGMHRGGTSATAGALEAAGIDFGPEPLPASADNPGGYYESRPVVQVDDALLSACGSKWDSPGSVVDEGRLEELSHLRLAARLALHRTRSDRLLWGVKEPRMARLLPFWKPLIEEMAEKATAVIVVRHPESVAASLAERDGMKPDQAMALWTEHMLAIERDTADMARIVISYEALVQDPVSVISCVGGQLGVPEFDPEAGAKAVERQWQHHAKTEVAPAAGLLDLAYESWRCFLEEAVNPGIRPRGFAFCHRAWEAYQDRESETQTDYDRWQRKQHHLHRVAVSGPGNDKFKFHAVCIVPSGREAVTKLTLESLAGQSDPAWELTVISGAEPPAVLDPRVTWIRTASPGISDALARLCHDSTRWTGFVDAGDRLHRHAVGLLARFIAERPGLRLVYTDEDQLDEAGHRINPHFKPDLNLELLRSLPYLGGLTVIREDLLKELPWRTDFPGAEEHDQALRILDSHGAEVIGHLPDVLYHRASGSYRSSAAIGEFVGAAGRAVDLHLERRGIEASVHAGPFPASFRVKYALTSAPRVSVLIPTRDQIRMLQRCIDTLLGGTDYPDLEVIVLDNDTAEPEARRFLDGLSAAESELEGRLKVVSCPGPFNYSAMINRGARIASGDYLLLLNNDVAILHPEWLREMMAHALQGDVGAVGARLLFPDGAVQHAGVILGTPADHPFEGLAGDAPGYFGRAQLAQDWSAVTAACLLVSAHNFELVGGFDEGDLAVAFNDVDFCLKLGAAGKRLVYTPDAVLLHEGSKSQREGTEGLAAARRRERYLSEARTMYERWLPKLAADPAYNPNMALRGRDFVPEPELPAPRYLSNVQAPRVICHPGDRHGSGEYRVLAPSRELNTWGRVEVHATEAFPAHPADLERIAPDAVVFQRQLEDHQLAAIEGYRHYSDAFCVFELDDLISNLPVKSAHRGGTPANVMQRLRRALSLCDRLVVSTPYLAEAYAHLASEVVVRPNYLGRDVWGGLRRATHADYRRPRVGWAGGAGHAGDLALLAPVVEALADEVDWIFFGMCPESLRRYVAELHPGVPLQAFPRALAALDLDLAVAPLEDVPFNRGKSNLRLLEYGACGFPVLASDIEPYRCDLPVALVRNRARDWIRAIRERLSETADLEEEGRNLRRAVLESWMLDQHVNELERAWLPEIKVPGQRAVKSGAGDESAVETRQVGHVKA